MSAKFGLYELTLGNKPYSFYTLQPEPLKSQDSLYLSQLILCKNIYLSIQLTDILAPNSLFFPLFYLTIGRM